MTGVQLGLGLLSIGRTWGVRNVAPPPASDALQFLADAAAMGIRFFDTAPAYAASERILGQFLSNTEVARDSLVVATKMGEFWDDATGSTFVSHAYEDLVGSIDRSMALLGEIDILQVHKATKENLSTPELMKALDYAQARGVGAFGASVSDMEAAAKACDVGRFGFIQFPYNSDHEQLAGIFDIANEHGIRLLINRPLAMGKLARAEDSRMAVEQAFRFVLQKPFSGWILTGTSSAHHLAQNMEAFKAAQS